MKRDIPPAMPHTTNADRTVPVPLAAAFERLSAPRPSLGVRLRKIEADLQSNRIDAAWAQLSEHLAKRPGDADALNLMARVQLRRGHRDEAISMLQRCLELAPDFDAARFNYANLIFRQNNFDAALTETETLLARDPGNPLFRQLKADILGNVGRDTEAAAMFEALAEENPERAECWINYGHALRGLGQRDRCIVAYREAIRCRPSFGLAYWSLANLKAARFSDEDIAAMRAQLADSAVMGDDRIHILFALGKALEDRKLYEQSFEQYAKANAAMRVHIGYHAGTISRRVADNKALFTDAFVKSRAGAGCDTPDPIFVMSLPRSGSTLVEQILSSHSMIEGIGELPYVPAIATRLEELYGGAPQIGFPKVLEEIAPAILRELGEGYLAATRAHRKLGRPFFVDKKPANFFYIGLIHLILPNAKIIDVRRHPMACCLSAFKHHFSTARPNLSELGRFYRDYLQLMSHFERVLPGRIHRVVYEDLVRDPESEIRKLFTHLGLPFEESLLRFYETERTVLTPSSEQVRRPITGEAVDHWRNYEPWLGPLMRSLGTAYTAYPAVPDELR